MLRFYATVAVGAMLAIFQPASLAGASGAPEKIPHSQDPPRADNGGRQTAPLTEHKGVNPTSAQMSCPV
jgi:hypothetical protein